MVFDLTGSVLELTIYRTRGEHANQYTTDGVEMKRQVSLVNRQQQKYKKIKINHIVLIILNIS